MSKFVEAHQYRFALLILIIQVASSFAPSSKKKRRINVHGLHTNNNDAVAVSLFAAKNLNDDKTPLSRQLEQKRRLFIFGNGNVAQSVSKYASTYKDVITGRDDNDTFEFGFDSITCTVRGDENAAPHPRFSDVRSKDEGAMVRLVLFENESEVVKHLRESTHILVTIPPQQQRENNSDSLGVEGEYNYFDPVLDYCQDEQNDDNSDKNNFKRRKCSSTYVDTILGSDLTSWIGYVSTTGVYGDHSGAPVDETSSTKCTILSKAHAYLDVERRWEELVRNRSRKEEILLTVFRCAGLYGNNFSALHTVWKKGYRPPDVDNDSYEERSSNVTSRIHLDDVRRAIVFSMVRTRTCKNKESKTTTKICEVYNLSDDEPAPRQSVMKFAYDLLQKAGYIPPSPRKDADARISERTRRRKTDSKRVLNQKFKSELLVEECGMLLFPTFREGLVAVLKGEWKQD